jgi:hypothetical protein
VPQLTGRLGFGALTLVAFASAALAQDRTGCLHPDLSFQQFLAHFKVRQGFPDQPRKSSSPIQRARTGQLRFRKIPLDERIEGPSKRTRCPKPCRDKHRGSRDGRVRRQATGWAPRRDLGTIQLPFGSFQPQVPFRQAARMLVSHEHDVVRGLKFVPPPHEKTRRLGRRALISCRQKRNRFWRSRYIRGKSPDRLASHGAEVFRAGLAAHAVDLRFE